MKAELSTKLSLIIYIKSFSRGTILTTFAVFVLGLIDSNVLLSFNKEVSTFELP